MKERPILFSEDQVRAILEGRMAQTRRVVKPQPDWKFRWCRVNQVGPWFHIEADVPEKVMHTVQCPYGTPGDRLWVRETTCMAPPDFATPDETCIPDDKGRPRYVSYKADGFCEDAMRDYGLKWTPSIHVPRWASRLTLEIVSVRAERLREISWEDAKAEGLESCSDDNYHGWKLPNGEMVLDPKDAFAELWESINGPGSWEENPWVWVVEFKRVL